jgi:hypothetical protein
MTSRSLSRRLPLYHRFEVSLFFWTYANVSYGNLLFSRPAFLDAFACYWTVSGCVLMLGIIHTITKHLVPLCQLIRLTKHLLLSVSARKSTVQRLSHCCEVSAHFFISFKPPLGGKVATRVGSEIRWEFLREKDDGRQTKPLSVSSLSYMWPLFDTQSRGTDVYAYLTSVYCHGDGIQGSVMRFPFRHLRSAGWVSWTDDCMGS